jgi:hypothetical protein
MKHLKYKAVFLFLVSFFFIGIASLHAQPPGAPDDGDAPVDGGIIMLAAAGAAVGTKKLIKRKK